MLSRSKHATRSNFPLHWSANLRRNIEIYFSKLDGRSFAVRSLASSRRRKIGGKTEGKCFPARYARRFTVKRAMRRRCVPHQVRCAFEDFCPIKRNKKRPGL